MVLSLTPPLLQNKKPKQSLCGGSDPEANATQELLFISPAQLSGGEVPERHRPIGRTGHQVDRVRRQGADPDGAATRVLQDRLDVARHRGPDHRGGVRGAGGQELPAGAEAAAVDAVTVTRQRREGQLGEVPGSVDPDRFVPGAGGQELR